MTKHLHILGAGGHSKVVYDCALAMGEYASFTFLDANPPASGTLFGWPVERAPESFADCSAEDGDEYFVAIGNNKLRQSLAQSLLAAGLPLATICHPSAVVSPSAQLQPGVLVAPCAVINAMAQVGTGCIVNTAAVVEHDALLGPYAHIAPNATMAGAAELHEGAFLGIGSTINPGIVVAQGATIGAGATVISDIRANSTAIGTPAKEK